MMDGQEKERIVRRIRDGGWKAVVFDIDGTLLHGRTANQAMFAELGGTKRLRRHEQDYASGRSGNDVVAEALATSFSGRTAQELTAALRPEHLIADAAEVAAALKRAGIDVLVATVTWRFVADWVARHLHAQAISGVELEERDGKLTGKVKRHAHGEDKTQALREWCRQRGVRLEECIAIGDSRSDLHLFRNVGLALAINASEEAGKAAAFAGNFDSLWQFFRHAPLGAPKQPPPAAKLLLQSDQ
jgi:phosphoserine phosphatase